MLKTKNKKYNAIGISKFLIPKNHSNFNLYVKSAVSRELKQNRFVYYVFFTITDSFYKQEKKDYNFLRFHVVAVFHEAISALLLAFIQFKEDGLILFDSSIDFDRMEKFPDRNLQRLHFTLHSQIHTHTIYECMKSK
jgi:hypothetical protein